MTGLFVFAAVNVWAADISIGPVTFTGTNSTTTTNITISATISGGSVTNIVSFTTTSTNGFNRRNSQPDQVTNLWVNTNWNPYFTGSFMVDITAAAPGVGVATTSIIVTVTRNTSNTVNSIQWSSAPYNAAGSWTNVDTNAVSLHDIGLNLDVLGVGSLGCNLLNVTNLSDPTMTQEQQDIAYTDTGHYKPAGTPYRFDVNLHARPRGFMGMGEIKRWIWAPVDTNVPDGPGRLTVDLTSCSPWRSSYSNALQSHVGFAPLFAPANSSGSGMPTGMIMCTSAHYMDVGPTNSMSAAGGARCGLYVNGHTGTNSYLKTFLSDAFLQQQFGLTNVYDATNVMTGFAQHFNTSGVSTDSVTEVTASFTRIVGGTGTNLVYDYNFDGVGDSGYEARMNFTFQSAVAAQIGMAVTNSPSVPTNVVASKGTYSDKVIIAWDSASNAASYMVWRSGTNDTNSAALVAGGIATTNYNDTGVVVNVIYYYWVKANNSAGASAFSSSDTGWASNSNVSAVVCVSVSADFDGDRLADPAVYNTNGNWKIKLSSGGYSLLPLADFLGGSGYTALAADFDGDGLADPAVYKAELELWAIKLSSLSYLTPTVITSFGGSGWEALAGDFDGDRLADPAIYQASTGTWKVKLSTVGWATITKPDFMGSSGWTAIAADFDGDGKVDPAIYKASTGSWIVMMSKANYGIAVLEAGFLGSTGYTGMAADFDGDRLADPTVVRTSTGNWKIKLSGGSYSLLDLPGFLGE